MSRLLILFLALALPALSHAQDRDLQEINRYVLTEAALTKYASAVQKLRPLAAQISSCDDEENAKSITAMTTRIDRVPAVKAAIQSAGLTPREYLVFSFAVFQAGLGAWALEQPGGTLPPGVSRANVDFYKSHRAKIEGIQPLDDGCDGQEEEEEPEEG